MLVCALPPPHLIYGQGHAFTLTQIYTHFSSDRSVYEHSQRATQGEHAPVSVYAPQYANNHRLFLSLAQLIPPQRCFILLLMIQTQIIYKIYKAGKHKSLYSEI